MNNYYFMVNNQIIFVVFLVLVLVLNFFLFIFLFKHKLQKSREDSEKVLRSSRRIYQILLENPDYQMVAQKIADAIPDELKFGTGILAIIDEERRIIKRVAASQTPQAEQAINFIKRIGIPFWNIEISMDDSHNLMARSLREKKPFTTTSVYDVLSPVLTPDQAQKVQEIMSTKTTFVFPIFLQNKPLGVFLASTRKMQSEISSYEKEVLNNFVTLAGLSLQNASLFTSLKLIMGQLTKANIKLEELDKLKDDFVSVASHELRTPMTAVRSYVWMALNRPDIELSDKMKRYLSRTLISTERLINLVNDMLNVSRIESGRVEITPEVFDISALASDIVEDILPKAQEKRIKVDVLKTPVPQVFADEEKVEQVLLNLLGNALKFTPVEGTITISFLGEANGVDISVKDNGVGISKDDLGRLFKKFGRLDNSYVAAATSGGTGLGLYISRSLVELMGGKIWVSSEGMGKGTTFTFSLPAATKEVIAQAQKYTKSAVGGDAKALEPVAI